MGARLSTACCGCLKKAHDHLTDIDGNTINLRDEFEQFNEDEPLVTETQQPKLVLKKGSDKKTKKTKGGRL